MKGIPVSCSLRRMVRTRTVRPNRLLQRVCLAVLSDLSFYTVKPDGTDLQVLFPKELNRVKSRLQCRIGRSPDGKRVVFTAPGR